MPKKKRPVPRATREAQRAQAKKHIAKAVPATRPDDHRLTASPERKAKVLAVLAQGLSITAAAASVNIGRPQLRSWRKRSPEFDKACDEAIEAGTDTLEDSVMYRAKDGYKKPVFQNGHIVGHVREFSDGLASFMLKARRPEKFKERIEQTGPPMAPVINIQLASREPVVINGHGDQSLPAPKAIVSVSKPGD